MMIGVKHGYGLEAIDFQKDNYHAELSEIFAKYKRKELAKDAMQDAVSVSVKKRFNIDVKLRITNDPLPNACMYPVCLDERNILLDRMNWEGFFNYCSEYYQNENYRTMQKIAKGDISDTGLIDYKKAKVGKLFSAIPSVSEITKGLIDIAEPEEIAAVYLHEIGHFFTFLSFLGVYTYRNAIIANVVNEYLGVKDDEEKVKIIIDKKNAWGIEVDEKDIVKLDDKNATTVLVGTFNRTFTRSVGYVQYDTNTSEVIADQFAQRMGAGKYLATGLHKMVGNGGTFNFSSNFQLFFGIIKIIGGVSAIVAGNVWGAVGIIMGAFQIYDAFGSAEATNGWTYDNNKDRFRRMYNEELTKLKSHEHSPEYIKLILTNLEVMGKIVDKVSKERSIPLTILRWCSSNFRDQEAKKQYQQMMEELMANQLYVSSAKLKTLGL